MAEGLKFFYLGDDEAYFRALQGELKKFAKIPLEFKRFFHTEEAKIQSLLIDIFNDRPDCVFIDFSKHTQDYLHLARLIARTPLEHPTFLTGLVDYLSPIDVLKESLITGTKINFIKSVEIFDVVFNVLKMLSPDAIGEHGFATASLQEDCEVGTLCKIGFVHHEGVHIETDFKLNVGDKIRLNHHWLNKRIIPSREAFVKEVSQRDLFYQFNFSADVDFLFIDDFIPPSGMTEIDIKYRRSERTELIKHHKKLLSKWIENNRLDSHEKKAKVLIVDNKFHFYMNQQRTDKHPYTLRCIPYFSDVEKDLSKLRPQVIAFEIDPEETGKNNLESLKKLVELLKQSVNDKSPYIFVFNTKLSSVELQQELGFSQILAYTQELSPEILLKCADMLHSKIIQDKSANTNKNFKLYIKKTHVASIAEIVNEVSLVKLSETDMILNSNYLFPPGTNLHFHFPVEMFVHIRPVEKPSGKIPEYYGLIHSIGEEEKKDLRRFINSVFFRDHDAQLAAELDEFKKLNELKLQEKQAANEPSNPPNDASQSEQGSESIASVNDQNTSGESVPKVGPDKPKP